CIRDRVALMDLLLGRALARRGDTPEAAQLAASAATAFADLGLVRWEAAAEVLRVRLEARGGQGPAAAAGGATRLRELHRRLPGKIYPLSAYQILEALGEAQERSGATPAAVTSYRRAIGKLEDLRVRIPTEQSKISFLEDKSHLYDRLLALEMRRRSVSVDRIFEIMERSRAQALWDRLRSPSADWNLPTPGGLHAAGLSQHDTPSSRRLQSMRQRLTWLHARLARLELGSAAEREQIAALRERLGTAESEWSRGLRQFAEEQGGTAAGPGGVAMEDGVPSVSGVTSVLPAGWGFVSYHIGTVPLAVVIDEHGAAVRRLPDETPARLVELIERLDFQWRAAAMTGGRGRLAPLGTTGAAKLLRSTADRILHDLHRLLWQPIEEMGIDRSRSWMISPHGAVHRVPMHALRDPSGYLVERCDLAIVPSARIWRGLPGVGGRDARAPAQAQAPAQRIAQASSRVATPPVAWIGGVDSPNLPIVRQEIEMVSSRLPGWTVRRDVDATASQLKENGPDASLIHIAAHGSLRSDNPAYSYLALADGPFFVHDLAWLRLPASTVVLSACSSGRGAAPAGEEWVGLARGFLGAGASTVVGSLWPVGDESTLDLMEGFYESFGAGASASRALGRAMRRALVRRPHPWEWAPFAVTGAV
ncbi:MAG: CHAT domain-containing protein, partial [Candidatus Eisenbacteria bacterium]|nr:CHAT domain-containing protein [Candidatus Eisenbacteria bacterium]